MFNRMCWTLCPLTVALVLATLVEMVLGKAAKAVTSATVVMNDSHVHPAGLPSPIASIALSHLVTILAIVAAVSVVICLAKKARSL
jgi:hypothetical protein